MFNIYIPARGYAHLNKTTQAFVKREIARSRLKTLIDDEGTLWVWVDRVSGDKRHARTLALFDAGCGSVYTVRVEPLTDGAGV